MGSLCTICAASCEQLLKSLTFGTYIKILRKAEVRPGLVRLGASGAPCCMGSGPRPSFQHHPPPPPQLHSHSRQATARQQGSTETKMHTLLEESHFRGKIARTRGVKARQNPHVRRQEL